MPRLSEIRDRLTSDGAPLVDAIRIYLGIGLLVRGYLFLGRPTLLTDSISQAGMESGGVLLYLIAWVHIAGGALLAVGLLTRLAALSQIPILVVAVFGVHLQQGLAEGSQSLEFSALVLFLLVVVFVRGSGPWSLDYYLRREEHAPSPPPPPPPTEEDDPLPVAVVPYIRSLDEIDLETVRPRPVFSKTSWVALLLGTPRLPEEVEYVDRESGEVVARTRNPHALEAFR